MSATEYRSTLMRAFHLQPGDLEANRTGWLSQHQVKRLKNSAILNLFGGFVLAAGMVGILVGVAERPFVPVQLILGFGLVIAALIYGSVVYAKSRAAAAAGTVEVLTGPVSVRMQGRAGWYLTVAGRTFRLPVRPWHIYRGFSYRVYVATKASRIIAMEPEGW
jgi:hypothetical protein